MGKDNIMRYLLGYNEGFKDVYKKLMSKEFSVRYTIDSIKKYDKSMGSKVASIENDTHKRHHSRSYEYIISADNNKQAREKFIKLWNSSAEKSKMDPKLKIHTVKEVSDSPGKTTFGKFKKIKIS